MAKRTDLDRALGVRSELERVRDERDRLVVEIARVIYYSTRDGRVDWGNLSAEVKGRYIASVRRDMRIGE